MIASIMSCRSESDDARGNVGVVPDRPMEGFYDTALNEANDA